MKISRLLQWAVASVALAAATGCDPYLYHHPYTCDVYDLSSNYQGQWHGTASDADDAMDHCENELGFNFTDCRNCYSDNGR